MGQTQTKKCITEPKLYSNEQHFIDNGGILLEKQIPLSRGQNTGSRQLKILSIDEIEKATNNYDPNLVVGSLMSTAFKGVIDDQVVAVKVPRNFHLNHHLIELYLTEAATSMVMNHENLVKIYGGCLETFIPVMVYEYLPNGNLGKYLHSQSNRITWSDRLRIATDIAYALSYMHNAMSRPMVHRNVQAYSILLDQSFRAKLTNFGYSVTLTPGETNQKWPVHGTPGYIDPEYIETQEVTEKCDFYSFGVLMLELLTSMDPIEMAQCGNDLVDEFVKDVEKNGFKTMMVDMTLKCVAKKGEERPSMMSVVEELWLIQDQVNRTT